MRIHQPKCRVLLSFPCTVDRNCTHGRLSCAIWRSINCVHVRRRHCCTVPRIVMPALVFLFFWETALAFLNYQLGIVPPSYISDARSVICFRDKSFPAPTSYLNFYNNLSAWRLLVIYRELKKTWQLQAEAGLELRTWVDRCT